MNDLQSPISVDLLRRIDAACDRFEESWRQGSKPRIEDYLTLFRADERSALLESLQSLQHELILSIPVVSTAIVSTPVVSAPVVPDYQQTIVFNSAEHLDKTILYPTEKPPSQTTNNDSDQGSVARVTFRVIAGPHEGKGFEFEKHDTLLAGRLSSAQLR